MYCFDALSIIHQIRSAEISIEISRNRWASQNTVSMYCRWFIRSSRQESSPFEFTETAGTVLPIIHQIRSGAFSI